MLDEAARRVVQVGLALMFGSTRARSSQWRISQWPRAAPDVDGGTNKRALAMNSGWRVSSCLGANP